MSLSERVGTEAPVRITSGDFAKRLTAKGIRFSMRNGVVKKLKPSEESKEADVLNVQRGKGGCFPPVKVFWTRRALWCDI